MTCAYNMLLFFLGITYRNKAIDFGQRKDDVTTKKEHVTKRKDVSKREHVIRKENVTTCQVTGQVLFFILLAFIYNPSLLHTSSSSFTISLNCPFKW
jgi:predicted Holliday junction resolvase-like endonuclease